MLALRGLLALLGLLERAETLVPHAALVRLLPDVLRLLRRTPAPVPAVLRRSPIFRKTPVPRPTR
ncbi:hypothetical protein GCM10027271_29900 [Saccharopolyspora gloriosae]